TVPPVQVTTFAASTAQPPENAGATKLSKTTPAGSGSRTTTPVASRMPLLPTTKLYVKPPRQTGGAGRFPGHDRAQTGSGDSVFGMVRSIDGLTVVSSVSVAVTPWFLMLPVTVAVLKIVDPAAAITRPLTVIMMVPPAFSVRAVQRTCGATMTHPP